MAFESLSQYEQTKTFSDLAKEALRNPSQIPQIAKELSEAEQKIEARLYDVHTDIQNIDFKKAYAAWQHRPKSLQEAGQTSQKNLIDMAMKVDMMAQAINMIRTPEQAISALQKQIPTFIERVNTVVRQNPNYKKLGDRIIAQLQDLQSNLENLDKNPIKLAAIVNQYHELLQNPLHRNFFPKFHDPEALPQKTQPAKERRLALTAAISGTPTKQEPRKEAQPKPEKVEKPEAAKETNIDLSGKALTDALLSYKHNGVETSKSYVGRGDYEMEFSVNVNGEEFDAHAEVDIVPNRGYQAYIKLPYEPKGGNAIRQTEDGYFKVPTIAETPEKLYGIIQSSVTRNVRIGQRNN